MGDLGGNHTHHRNLHVCNNFLLSGDTMDEQTVGLAFLHVGLQLDISSFSSHLLEMALAGAEGLTPNKPHKKRV